MSKKGDLKILHRLDYERSMLNAFEAGMLAAEIIRHENYSEDARKVKEEFIKSRGFQLEILELPQEDKQ